MMVRRILLVATIILVVLGTTGLVVQAQAPNDPSEEPRGGLFLTGRLVDATDTALTIETRDGQWRVSITDETRFRLPGVAEATVDDLEVGKPLMVRGSVLGVGEMEAETISAPAREQRRTPRELAKGLRQARGLVGTVRGEIAAVDDDGFRLSNPQHDALAVAVTDDTVYRVPGGEDAGLDDLQVGQLVVVKPASQEDGFDAEKGVVAEVVGVVDQRQMTRINGLTQLLHRVRQLLGHSGMRGEVTAIESGADATYTLTVETARGAATIRATEDTVVHVGGEEGTVGDLHVGDRIAVVGKPDISCPIDAGHIGVLPVEAEQ